MSTKTPPQSRRSRRHLEYASAPGAPAALPAALNAHSVMTILCGDFEATTSLGMKEDAVKDDRRIGLRLAAYTAVPANSTDPAGIVS
jgi:hypothetical protein